MSEHNDDTELGPYPLPQPEDHDEHDTHNSKPPPHSHEALPVNDQVVKIAATLLTAGIIALTTISVSTARKVDVLLDRPIPVSMEQYQREQRWMQQQIDELKHK